MSRAKKGDEDLQPDQPYIIFPEWSESDINAEKWSSKHVFEDPDGQVFLPKSVRKQLEGFKRASELIADSTAIFIGTAAQIDEMFSCQIPSVIPVSTVKEPHKRSVPRSATPQRTNRAMVEPSFDTGSTSRNIQTPDIEINSTPDKSTTTLRTIHDNEVSVHVLGENDTLSKFYLANKHLFQSEFMLCLLSSIHYLYDQNRFIKGEETAQSWENIYPKGKDGSPALNPSGKYCVKMWWLGAWRKVTVDDKIPIDAAGKPLLLCSPNMNEIWPLILSKALLKVSNASYKDDGISSEFGDFDILTCLRGWIPECISLNDNGIKNAYYTLANLLTRRENVVPKARPRMGSIVNSIAPAPIQGRPSNSSNISIPGSAGSTPQGRVLPTAIVFAYRDPKEFFSDSLVGSPAIPYRIIDFQQSVGILGKTFLVRPYFTSGTGKAIDDFEYAEYWMTLQEIAAVFPYVVVYHTPSSFKVTKSITNIYDPQKPVETFRIPYVLCTAEDLFVGQESGILVMVSTYGRAFNQKSSGISCLIEEYVWKSPEVTDPVLRMASNGFSATFFNPTPGVGYKISMEGHSSYSISIYSREDFSLEDESKFLMEKNGLKMREWEDTLPPQQPGSWAILFKHIIMAPEPLFIATCLYCPEAMAVSTCLRAINNDTGEELPQVSFSIYPQIFPATKNGYTLIAESRAQQIRQATKWKFRMFADNLTLALAEKEFWHSKMTVQDFNEPYIPNKHNVLFRSVLKVKDAPIDNLSIQTTFTQSNVWLQLTLYDNDIEVFTQKGKGTVTLNGALLYLAEEPIPVKLSKDDKKSVAPVVAPVTLPKHKYILEAYILPSEVDKLSAAANTRPASRGKLLTSAGKKKSKVSSAGTGPNQVLVSIPLVPSPVAPDAEFSWHLRLISTDSASIILTKDTEKDDRYRAIKENWETSSPGRMARAREQREQFVKQLDSGSLRPLRVEHRDTILKSWSLVKEDCPKALLVPEKCEEKIQKTLEEKSVYEQIPKPSVTAKTSRPPSGLMQVDASVEALSSLTGVVVSGGYAPVVLHSAELEDQAKSRKLTVQTFADSHAEMIKSRTGEKEKRSHHRKLLLDIVEQKLQEIEYLQKHDRERRDVYRAKYLAEKEEEAQTKAQANMDATRAAEMIGENEDASDKQQKAVKKAKAKQDS